MSSVLNARLKSCQFVFQLFLKKATGRSKSQDSSRRVFGGLASSRRVFETEAVALVSSGAEAEAVLLFLFSSP